MSGRYWLDQGPVTRDEVRRAQAFFKKKGLPFDRRSEAFRNFVSRLRKRREVNRYVRGKEAAAADPSAPWQIVYGNRTVGGALTFIHSSGPNANDPDRFLHLIVTIACHEVQWVRAVFFDGYQVPWDADLLTRPTGVVNALGILAGLVQMQVNYGSDGQAALSYPVSQTTGHNPVGAKWTSTDRQRGHAHVYLRLTNNENVFKNGTPEITFAVTGKTDVVDPRTGTFAPGASNTAMVLYDYMTNARFGLGVSPSAFESARLIQAVNDCEAAIGLAAGGSENRYLVDALVTTDESPGAVVEQLLASMAGHLVYSAGKWNVYAGVPRDPVLTIDEDMILSDVRLLTKTPRIDNFNTVRATYPSGANGDEETDAPEARNTAYIAEDGGQVVAEDLTYQYVTSGSRVQRLMKIEMNEARQGRFVEFTARLAAYQAEAGEWVAVTFARFGWVGQQFRVVRTRLQADPSPGGPPLWTVQVTAKAIEDATYDWLAEESPADQYPDTNLPNPFVVQPVPYVFLASGTANLFVRADGTVFTRLFVTWGAAPDSFVQSGGYYEVQYYAAEAMLDWVPFGDVPGTSTSCYILDVLDQVGYQARVRSVNALGARSAWVTSGLHVVVGKTAPPSNVAGLQAAVDAGTIRLTWLPVPDLDVREYEVRYAAGGQTWEQAAGTAVRVRATAYTRTALPAGAWTFLVRAIDTSGNYSAANAAVALAVSAPGPVQNLAVTQVDNTVLIDWQEPLTATFPVDRYLVYKQDAARVALLGEVRGTFFTYVEPAQGTYTYLVAAFDGAGNGGPLVGVQATVYPPPDYVPRSSASLLLSGAALANASYIASPFTVNAAANTAETWAQHFETSGVTTVQGLIGLGYTFWLEPLTGGTGTVALSTTGPSVWLPCDAAETWAQHFTQNNAATVQDLVNQNLTYWLQPNDLLTGTVTLDHDLGETLPQGAVSFAFESISNGIRPTAQVFWKKLAGDPWTAGPLGRLDATPAAFRYLRLVLTARPATVTDWCVASNVSFALRVKEITDGGTVSVSASDVGGTTVSFTKGFFQVSSLTVSAQGTVELKALRDFSTATLNPTTFKAFLYDAAGARAGGTISWIARGVQAVI
ncbi:MAG: hypothetical protein K2X87_09205 [Gemmataceae bacterium]|nr:hypothetical protein [Gemmataceae bacterium]